MIGPLDPMLQMQELRHRMDNTLQMVGGLLGRQARAAADPACDILLKAEAQVQAFALLNRVLDAATVAGETDPCAAAYLERLCAHLGDACLTPFGIALATQFDRPCPLDERRCRALGLITTELVLNAVKHAFVGRKGGSIGVCLGRLNVPPRLALGVMDDGCGMGGLPREDGQGLGFVRMLARSVGGEVRIESGCSGTRIAILVPLA